MIACLLGLQCFVSIFFLFGSRSGCQPRRHNPGFPATSCRLLSLCRLTGCVPPPPSFGPSPPDDLWDSPGLSNGPAAWPPCRLFVLHGTTEATAFPCSQSSPASPSRAWLTSSLPAHGYPDPGWKTRHGMAWHVSEQWGGDGDGGRLNPVDLVSHVTVTSTPSGHGMAWHGT
ncbi:hypothetical protein B0T22DRAFT_149501 [Podospora appendiculata]|uniref:Secreted protein n=1 Tax=Podospora appendiculata TaxID=314037 RepID=A0AAE0X9F6_9PEZI|nr:hypothetical protein B0T22DRAFT_149501 [Podospora appendiculata]